MTASASIMNTVGAFPYAQGSTDTAMLVTAPVGNNTAQVSGVSGTSGNALFEIYDADTGTPTSRLINLSAWADVGTGNNILIEGSTSAVALAETVLIRAVGSGLNDASGHVPAVRCPGPAGLEHLFQGGTLIYSNTMWAGDATIASVFPTVGAFQPESRAPGFGPDHASGRLHGANLRAGGGTGIALFEVYEVY